MKDLWHVDTGMDDEGTQPPPASVSVGYGGRLAFPHIIIIIVIIIVIITKTYKAPLSVAVQSNVDNYTQKN